MNENEVAPRRLGKNESAVYGKLIEHKYWHAGCGWYWDTGSGTRRLLDSLVRKGFARVDEVTIGGKKVWLPA